MMLKEFRKDLKKLAIKIKANGDMVTGASNLMLPVAPVDAVVLKATNWVGNTGAILVVAGVYHTTKHIENEIDKIKLKSSN